MSIVSPRVECGALNPLPPNTPPMLLVGSGIWTVLTRLDEWGRVEQ
ncbi:hypothetical protein HQ571_05885 [Candidatus Kuenenbacteria bacterium]|nr:hypothetical protein [Candidatus Kuenenbacteria bacterium]